jgi:hypothetical protein
MATKAKKTGGGATPGPDTPPTIYWECDAGPDWQWQSGDPSHAGFPVTVNDSRTGTIVLPSNPGYWYPCIQLMIGGTQTIGYACLRYFVDQKGNNVQAMVYCPGGGWSFSGLSGKISQTSGNGGFNLSASFKPLSASRKGRK